MERGLSTESSADESSEGEEDQDFLARMFHFEGVLIISMTILIRDAFTMRSKLLWSRAFSQIQQKSGPKSTFFF